MERALAGDEGPGQQGDQQKTEMPDNDCGSRVGVAAAAIAVVVAVEARRLRVWTLNPADWLQDDVMRGAEAWACGAVRYKTRGGWEIQRRVNALRLVAGDWRVAGAERGEQLASGQSLVGIHQPREGTRAWTASVVMRTGCERMLWDVVENESTRHWQAAARMTESTV